MTVRLSAAARRYGKRFAPPGTARRRAALGVLAFARAGARRTRWPGPAVLPSGPAPPALKSEATRYAAPPGELAEEYRRWRQLNEPDPGELDRLRRANRVWPTRPLVTVVLAAARSAPGLVAETIDSVVAQVYDRWELYVVGGSPSSEIAQTLDRYAADARVRLGPPETASPAAGEWVLRLEAGDRLRPEALHRIVDHIGEHPDDDVVYADGDLLSPEGVREHPHLKPDWSPEYLLSTDYLGVPTVIRRSLLAGCALWDGGADPAREHDLHLRATEQASGVGHVAAVLASRPTEAANGTTVTKGTTVANGSVDPVSEALRRRDQPGRVSARTDQLGEVYYEVRYELQGRPSVDIVIPTRDHVELLRACIESVRARSTYDAYSIIVVDNDSVEEATHRYLAQQDVRVVPGPGPFNFSRLVNTGVRASSADYVLLLNNDVVVQTDDWIEALLELGQKPDVGAVGGRLLFPDGSVQHEGVALLPEYTAANVSWPLRVIRDTSAVTAACMLVSRAAYWAIDGFDENMGIVYNDVDFCLRMRRSGRRVLYTPYAELEHDESSSRGKTNPTSDIDLFFSRWGRPGDLADPHLSPHVLWPCPQRLRIHGGKVADRS